MFGVSGDSVERQKRFHAALGLRFGLLSDTTGEARAAFAAYHGLLPLPGRVTVVLDARHVVRRIWRGVADLDAHGDEVAEAVAALQASDAGMRAAVDDQRARRDTDEVATPAR